MVNHRPRTTLRADIYGIRIRKLTVYWTRPFGIWWGDRPIWNGRWW